MNNDNYSKRIKDIFKRSSKEVLSAICVYMDTIDDINSSVNKYDLFLFCLWESSNLDEILRQSELELKELKQYKFYNHFFPDIETSSVIRKKFTDLKFPIFSDSLMTAVKKTKQKLIKILKEQKNFTFEQINQLEGAEVILKISKIKDVQIECLPLFFQMLKYCPKQIKGQEKNSFNVKESQVINNNQKEKYYSSFGVALNDLEYQYNPLIGREKEFRKFCAHLMDKEKSVIIYGPPGVGKTTLAKGLAYKIKKKQTPVSLSQKEIILVSSSTLISGCKYRGDLEARMEKFIEEAKENPNYIYFIDEIHTLIGLGQGENDNIDVSNILKQSLGEGQIKIIGATTTNEYNIIQKDSAFSRRFLPVELKQLTDDEVLYILDKHIPRLTQEEQIEFNFNEETKNLILNTLITITSPQYQNDISSINNPDAALTLLRSGYNYAKLDGVKELNLNYMIEGIENSSLVNQKGIEHFKQKVYTKTNKIK